MEQKAWPVYNFGKRNIFRLDLNESREAFCQRGRGRQPENRKGAGTNSGESGARNLEARSIRSGAESMGGRVKLKTVTEIRFSHSVKYFFIPFKGKRGCHTGRANNRIKFTCVRDSQSKSTH